MSEGPTIGVVLSGAGYLDGAELHEAVLCLLYLDQAGANVRIFAPDVELEEVDHLSGKGTGKKRSVLVESARVARGNIAALSSVQGTDVDGWVIPGGFGAAKNLSDFASKGEGATANKQVARVIREALAAHMPIGACCIAPAVLATVTRASSPKLTLTIGDDTDTASALQGMGSKHVDCPVDDIVCDEKNHVVTAPAYMYDTNIAAVAKGIEKMVQQVLAWA